MCLYKHALIYQNMHRFLTTFIFLALASCTNPSYNEQIATDSTNTQTPEFTINSSKQVEENSDTLQIRTELIDSVSKGELTRLVQDMYYWWEASNIEMYGFDFIFDDTVYISLENEALLSRIEDFQNSNYFTQSFIDNYENLAHLLDQKLQSKDLVYFPGEYPPYRNGANPWCNCQDYPETFWNYIKLKNLNVRGDSASFDWTLENQPYFEDFKYSMRAKKVNGKWRLSYLQEFDIESLFGVR